MKKSIRGQSLFEVIVTLLVVSLVVTAIAGLAILGIKSSNFSRDKTLATRYVQEANEWLRGERDTDWTAFKSNSQAHATICLQTLGWPGTCGAINNIFTRKADFVFPPDGSIQATVTVSWTDSGGTHLSQSITYFSDWQNK